MNEVSLLLYGFLSWSFYLVLLSKNQLSSRGSEFKGERILCRLIRVKGLIVVTGNESGGGFESDK